IHMISRLLKNRRITARRLLTPARTAASLLGMGLLLAAGSASAQQAPWALPPANPAQPFSAAGTPIPHDAPAWAGRDQVAQLPLPSGPPQVMFERPPVLQPAALQAD